MSAAQGRPTFISLFSGMGGFDLGLERAGFDCVAQVEIDKHCNAVLARHWPNVRRYEDVTKVSGQNLPNADVICGGFPCQDISLAGGRRGLGGERSGLWWQFYRILSEQRPAWCLIENVPGLRSSGKRRDMGAILGSLGELGYGWAYTSLDSQYAGLAQQRERVFIVGHLGDSAGPAEVLFEPEGSGGDTPPSREAEAGVARTITARSNVAGSPERDDTDFVIAPPLAYALTGRSSGERLETEGTYVVRTAQTGSNGWGVQRDVALTLDGGNVTAEGHDASEDGTGRGTPLVFDWQSGGDVRHNVSDKHTSALQSSQVPAVFGPFGVRRLTPLECLRVQGFPDDWLNDLGLRDSAKYRMCGNAVSVPVIEWIGARLLAALRAGVSA